MAEMTVDEAFRRLGISKDATLRDATKAYHDLSKNIHPDTSAKGSADEQAQLNEAHEIVVAVLQRGSGGYLVPVEVKHAVEILERGIVRQEASRESEAFVSQATSRRTRPLQSLKYMAFLMAAFAAFFGWVSNDAGFGGTLDPEMLRLVKFMAFTLAGMGGTMQLLVQHQTHMIDRFRDMMSNEDHCIAFLNELGISPEQSYTLPDLLNEHRRNYRSPISGMRSVLSLDRRERIELALLKGLELGILERPANSRRRYQVTAEFRPMFL